MSLKCRRTIGLRVVAPPDMPLDAAVYVASANAIFGVRGGYVYKMSADTGAVQSVARYSRHHQGKSCICYVPNDPLGGYIYCANWHDPGTWAATTTVRYENLRIHRINTSLALVGTFDLHGAGPTLTFNRFHSGIYNLLYDSANVYAIASDSTNARLMRIDPTTYPAGGSWATGSTMGYDGYYINDIVPYSGALWTGYPAFNVFRQFNGTTCIATGTTLANGPPETMGFCYAAGYFWGGYYVQAIAKVDVGGIPFSTVNVEVSACAVHRVRYDTTNNRLFTANTYANSVSWLNPSSHPPVYYKTGFDYPVDIVFTGTKAFAVQAGAVPLKEIDITAPTGTVP